MLWVLLTEIINIMWIGELLQSTSSSTDQANKLLNKLVCVWPYFCLWYLLWSFDRIDGQSTWTHQRTHTNTIASVENVKTDKVQRILMTFFISSWKFVPYIIYYCAKMDSSLGKVKTRTVVILLLLSYFTSSVNGKL